MVALPRRDCSLRERRATSHARAKVCERSRGTAALAERGGQLTMCIARAASVTLAESDG